MDNFMEEEELDHTNRNDDDGDLIIESFDIVDHDL